MIAKTTATKAARKPSPGRSLAACTWCNATGATVTNRDAGGQRHHWHPRCWNAMRAWLRGHSPPERLGPAWDRGCPKQYRGIKHMGRAVRR